MVTLSFEGVSELLGLTREQHVRRQIRGNLELYERMIKLPKLERESEELERVICNQVKRLHRLDESSGWIVALFQAAFRLFIAVCSGIIVWLLSDSWGSFWPTVGAVVFSSCALIYLFMAIIGIREFDDRQEGTNAG